MSRALITLVPRLYTTTPNPPKYPFSPLAHPLPGLTTPEANPRPIPPAASPFALIAALSWAGVMYMFRHRGERLQPGIVNSMRKLQPGVSSRSPTDSSRLPLPRLRVVAQPQDPALAQQVILLRRDASRPLDSSPARQRIAQTGCRGCTAQAVDAAPLLYTLVYIDVNPGETAPQRARTLYYVNSGLAYAYARTARSASVRLESFLPVTRYNSCGAAEWTTLPTAKRFCGV